MGFRLSIYQTQISSIKKPEIKKIDTRITTTPIICSSPSTTQHPHHHLQKSSPTPPPHYHQPTINQTLTTSHPNPTFSRRRDRRLGDRRLRQQKKIAGKHHHSGGQETKPSRSMSRTHRLPVTRCHDLRRLMASSSRGGGVVVPVEKIEAAAAVDDEPSMRELLQPVGIIIQKRFDVVLRLGGERFFLYGGGGGGRFGADVVPLFPGEKDGAKSGWRMVLGSRMSGDGRRKSGGGVGGSGGLGRVGFDFYLVLVGGSGGDVLAMMRELVMVVMMKDCRSGGEDKGLEVDWWLGW
ncbi:hypothetical protein LWI29_009065 [Acer saccharum]|uniref:Uncharacterized protein n=1 Tax=Acer saccharum TaxID=4024 RepID=A0AA39VRE1_ACESA|nr:hypothetical protein LWI29_009065 [Acer saccharum]